MGCGEITDHGGVFFNSFAMVRDGMSDRDSLCNDPWLTTQSGVVVVFLLPAGREPILEILVFALLCESDYDVFFGFFAFSRASEVLWSDGSSVGWIPYLPGTAESSNVRSFERVPNRWTIGGARYIVEKYEEVTVFVHARSSLVSTADVQRQFAECCAEVDGQSNDCGEKVPNRTHGIPATFQLQFKEAVSFRLMLVRKVLLLFETFFFGDWASRSGDRSLEGV